MKRFLSISALLALTLAAVPATFSQSAADVYKTKCAACHGADGKGNTAIGPKIGVRDFASPEVKKETDAELIAITTDGKKKMPGYAGKLTNEQIKAQIAFIRALK